MTVFNQEMRWLLVGRRSRFSFGRRGDGFFALLSFGRRANRRPEVMLNRLDDAPKEGRDVERDHAITPIFVDKRALSKDRPRIIDGLNRNNNESKRWRAEIFLLGRANFQVLFRVFFDPFHAT